MFGWASSRLESLAQTVAPPPTDSKTKFAYCCQRGDEQGAMQILQQEIADPVHTVIKLEKGHTAFHLACLNSMTTIIQTVMQQQQSPAYLQVTDSEGNTALHFACQSNQPNALEIVKILLAACQNVSPSPVCAKNVHGRTPYDMASLNSVRQHLLPIQLQAETQHALDNGGAGLPPGIDLGGLKITNSHLPPPPVGMPGMQPQQQMQSTSQYASYPPTPGLPASPAYPPIPGLPQNESSTPAAAHPPTSGNGQQVPNPGMFTTPSPHHPDPSQAVPPPAATPSPAKGLASPPSAASALSRPPAAPSSANSQQPRTYALTGRSSAAFSSSKGIQPDGFHSSSSDKNLQEKYGHVNSGNSMGSAVPPPPSSGNSLASAPSSGGVGPIGVAAAGGPNPYAAGSGGPNPYSFGKAALGSSRSTRYPVYDAVTGRTTASQLPTPPSGRSPLPTPPPAAAGFHTFTPSQSPAGSFSAAPQSGGSFGSPSPAATQQQPLASFHGAPQPGASSPAPQEQGGVLLGAPQPVATTLYPSPTKQPHHTQLGKTPANTPVVASVSRDPATVTSSTFLPPPPYQTRGGSVPARQGLAGSVPTVSSGSTGSASNVFGRGVTPSPSSGNAQNFFSSPANGNAAASAASQLKSASNHAASVFGSNPGSRTPSPTKVSQESSSDAPTPAPVVQTKIPYERSTSSASDASALFSKPSEMNANVASTQSMSHAAPATVVAGGEEDELQDIPLSPKDPPIPGSLVGSIGMPPPPFTRK